MDDPYKIFRVNVKFMDEKWVDSFVNEGLLFMNNIQYFRAYEHEDISLRGDPNEGLEATYNAESLDMYFGDIKLDAIGKVDIRYNHQNETNIFCLTRISDGEIWNSPDQEFYLSRNFEKFGNRAVVIKDVPEFTKRLKKALNTCSNIYSIEENNQAAGQVAYVKRDEHHGKLGVFTKFDDYAWQHEWRIAFKQIDGSGPFKLYLGDLSDIVFVSETKTLLDQPIKLVTKQSC